MAEINPLSSAEVYKNLEQMSRFLARNYSTSKKISFSVSFSIWHDSDGSVRVGE